MEGYPRGRVKNKRKTKELLNNRKRIVIWLWITLHDNEHDMLFFLYIYYYYYYYKSPLLMGLPIIIYYYNNDYY